MSTFFDDENGEYLVVVNDEGQYSLWRPYQPVPDGWTPVGPRAARSECLAYIEQHWTDMRPKSLIEAMSRREAGNTDAATTD